MAPLRLFIVDDHVLFVEMLEAYLQRYDWIDVVGVAQDVQYALDRVGSTQPDMVLLDIKMPSRNGLELIPELRGLVPGLLVIMLTFHTQPAYRDAAELAGADGYVLKQDLFVELIPEIERIAQQVLEPTFEPE